MKIVAHLDAKERMDFDVVMATGEGKRGNNSEMTRIKKLESSKLFDVSNAVMIEHDQEIYFLRLTRHNKLILTK